MTKIFSIENAKSRSEFHRLPEIRNHKPTIKAVSIASKEGRTDVTNGRRFARFYKNKVRYCHPWKKWLVWDGRRWKIDDDGTIKEFAKQVSDRLWQEARQADDKGAFAFAVSSASSNRAVAMLSLAQSEPGIPIQPAELDTDPFLLNCPNGTIDLRSGKLRQHDPSDYITKLCPTEYDADAPTIAWDKFLDRVFDGRQDIISFVQRYHGYCVSGGIREQACVIYYGNGSNGKSTLLQAYMNAIGGDYTLTAPSGLLMEKKYDAHPTERVTLFGKRFVADVESGEGSQLNETLLKQLTGGEDISARRCKEDFWVFSATHKLVLCTNHKPRIKGTDHAIWRRLRIVPLDVKFWNPDEGETGRDELRQDKALTGRLRDNAAGILAWAVRGCLQWQAEGLGMPDAVRAATTGYRDEQDIVGRFIRERCERDPETKIRFSDLYAAIGKFCESEVDGGVPTKTNIGTALKRHGFERTKDKTRHYGGLRLTQ